MDSYVGLVPRPLYLLPAAAAMHINQEGGTSCRSPPPLRRESEGEAWSRQFPIGPAYTFHGTLRMSCLSCADNSLGLLWRGRGEWEGETSRGAFLKWKCRSVCLLDLSDGEFQRACTLQLFSPVSALRPVRNSSNIRNITHSNCNTCWSGATTFVLINH